MGASTPFSRVPQVRGPRRQALVRGEIPRTWGPGKPARQCEPPASVRPTAGAFIDPARKGCDGFLPISQ